MARTFEVAANATAELGMIAWSGQGVFLIEAEMDGDRLRNYYLYGDPPFDFTRFSPLLVEARLALALVNSPPPALRTGM
jgi:hypothetical protein